MAALHSGRDERRSLVWRWPWLRLALAAIPAGLTFALVQSPDSPRLAKLLVLTVFAASALAPPAGLLIVAAVAPLGPLLAAAAELRLVRVTDAIVVAFIAGWLLRGGRDRAGPTLAAPSIAWLFGAVVFGSLAGVLWHAGVASASAALDSVRGWFLVQSDGPDAIAAIRLIAGVALTAATMTLFRHRPNLAVRLPVTMVGSGVVAAVWLSVTWPARGVDVGIPEALHRAFAAYFALVLCLSIGMTGRSRGRGRLVWILASCCIAIGVLSAMPRASDLVSAFGRTGPLIDASLRAIASRPLFGVGIGQETNASPLFVSPQLSWNVAVADSHNLLVIGVELGLVGLGLWLLWIGAGFWRVARALMIDRHDARLWGAVCGVAAFVAALAVSRPLAVGETAFPFLLQFGLMTALAGSTLLNASTIDGSEHAGAARAWTRKPRRRFALSALGMAVIAAGALVSARRGPVERPDLQDAGFYGWETSASGERFRWTDQFASLFVDGDVTLLRMPIRAPTSAATVELKTDSGRLQRVDVASEWSVIEVVLPASERTHRIDLRTSQRIQVGECQVVRHP